VIVLPDGRRDRHNVRSVRARSARWLAAALVGFILVGWAATVYGLVLIADGLSPANDHIDWWAHVIAVALIAATAVPVWRWLRLSIDDVVYGHFGDGSAAITRLNHQIDNRAPSPPAGLDSSLAAMIARTLNVPYVAIVEGETEAGVVGTRPSDRDLADVPLTYQGNELGHLFVAPRHPRTSLSNRDLNLLSELGQQLAIVMFAIRASEQLQSSRAALVTAREEERRRIRRDLHDGLGPSLASMKLQLTAVDRLLMVDPHRAASLLSEVRDGMNKTTTDIRRLVYGLRPPLLDELGLVAALRNHPSAQAGLTVTVEPDELPELPAAVEVALYRIASEAIHNAARHSGGQQCRVTIEVRAEQVCMTVRDDGRGCPEPLIEGVGVASIRERAAELGGAVEVFNATGTTVRTLVPLESAKS